MPGKKNHCSIEALKRTQQRATLTGAEQCANCMQQLPPNFVLECHLPHSACMPRSDNGTLKMMRGPQLAATRPRRATPLRAPHLAMVRFSSENSCQGIPSHFCLGAQPNSCCARLPVHFFRRLFGPEEEPPPLPPALRTSLISLAALLIVALSSST